MNYKQQYLNLVSTRRDRVKDPNGYYENHHIIPSCMGGSNDESNLIAFTAREHYMAHWLLWKMALKSENNDNIYKLGKAFCFMAIMNGQNERTIKAHQFERIRIAASISGKLYVCSDETKQKLSEAGKRRFAKQEEKDKLAENMRGKTHSEETKEKMSKAKKGKPKSDEAKENMRLAWEKRRLTPVSEETKKKQSESRKRYIEEFGISEEVTKKIGDANRGQKRSEEQKNNIKDGKKNNPMSAEGRQSISEANRGKIPSEETIRKRVESRAGYQHSEETKQKIGDGNRGKTVSEDTKKKLSDAAKRQWDNLG